MKAKKEKESAVSTKSKHCVVSPSSHKYDFDLQKMGSMCTCVHMHLSKRYSISETLVVAVVVLINAIIRILCMLSHMYMYFLELKR